MTNKFEQLKTDGVATVPYPKTLRVSVVEASQLWAQFLDLPQDVRDSYAMTDGSIGSGYERKEGVGVNADVKQNFDVSAKSIDSMPNGVETEAATQFIDAAKDLSDRMTTYAVETAQETGDVFDIDSLRTISANGLETFVRFLRYPAGTTEGELLAQPHTDQSGFTFHLYEDTDGCERLGLDKSSWESMPVHEGEAAIFGAMQLQYQSGGEIPALSHRVVANKVSQNAGRIAIVCFVRFTDLPFYDKDANGRLQEVEPGKFYDMPTEDFKKLFHP